MKSKEVSESKYYRKYILREETKSSAPMIMLVIIFALGALAVYVAMSSINRNNIATYGVGNPYNCIQCKELGFACSKHKNFNPKQQLKEKVEKYTDKFIPNATDGQSKHWMYNGEDYNTNCDFCNKNKKECYSDETDRKLIDEKINQISADTVFKSKLNNEDWKLGYPNSKEGKALLIQEIKSALNITNN